MGDGDAWPAIREQILALREAGRLTGDVADAQPVAAAGAASASTRSARSAWRRLAGGP